MKENIKERLMRLRNIMKARKLDAVIIPQADPHGSEYLADHWQARRYLSGFTGSAGDLVVTMTTAALWTDSRYFIQASQQLADTGIVLMKSGLEGTPTINNWLMEQVPSNGRVGLDGWLFNIETVDNLIEDLALDITVDTNCDIIDEVWDGRPSLPMGKAIVHEVKYAGEDALSKLAKICERLASGSLDAILISALDEIAWTLNLRGRDVECNPVNTCYLYISPSKKVLFIEPEKLDKNTSAYLDKCGVTTMPYQEIVPFLRTLPSSLAVLVDEDTTSYGLSQALGENRCIVGTSPVPMLKAIKNEVQAQGFRNAMRRDGAALSKAFKEIEDRLQNGTRTTEMDVADILKRHRAQQPLFFEESFETIAGYGPHGAIVHYSATPETDIELKAEGLLLVDSGAQYLDGTTDITRTIALGIPTAQEKRDFTLVLKGMLAVAMAVFPQGTRGIQLDTLAHQFLWRAGQNYLHGTGHGIGHFLNVHEGPQAVRNNGRNWNIPIEAGMVVSDEPGLYKEGEHGVRCENVLLCIEADIPGSDGFRYLAFETLTLFPFDRNLIDTYMLSADEKEWIDAYHKRVYAEIAPLLDTETAAWLADKTKPLD